MMTITQFFTQFGGVSAGVAKILDRYTRVASVLPVEKISTLAHKYGQEESLGTVGVRAINQPFPVTLPGTVNPVEEPIAVGGGMVFTDHRVEAA